VREPIKTKETFSLSLVCFWRFLNFTERSAHTFILGHLFESSQVDSTVGYELLPEPRDVLFRVSLCVKTLEHTHKSGQPECNECTHV